jgi:hypothetical protein
MQCAINGGIGGIYKVLCHLCAVKFIVTGNDLSKISKHLSGSHGVNEPETLRRMLDEFYLPKLGMRKSPPQTNLQANESWKSQTAHSQPNLMQTTGSAESTAAANVNSATNNKLDDSKIRNMIGTGDREIAVVDSRIGQNGSDFKPLEKALNEINPLIKAISPTSLRISPVQASANTVILRIL